MNLNCKMLNIRTILRDPVWFHRACISSSCNERAVANTASYNEDERKISTDNNEEFRVYEIVGLKKKETTAMKKNIRRRPVLPPRYLQMPIDQDWTKVWPAAASFKYSVVPFPVRQGYIKKPDENEGVVPGKYANAELMKIPNFLHLSPAHVKKHCEAIQKFCTAWPEKLDSDEQIEKHFPLSVTTYTHCFSGPSIRHPKARVVKIQFKLSKLGLDNHGRDKFIRLVGERFNAKTDITTIEADRCPVRKQNYDYLKYLLTALFFESQKIEPWESMKEESDWERFFWDKSKSKSTLLNLLHIQKNIVLNSDSSNATILDGVKADSSDEAILQSPVVQQYRGAVVDLVDEGEDSVTISKYKDAVIKLFNLKKF